MKKGLMAIAVSMLMAFSCLTACSESSSAADSSKTETSKTEISKTESITASSIETVSPVDDVPEDPAADPDDGYWHDDTTTTMTTTTTTTTTTKATTKAAPKYDYSAYKECLIIYESKYDTKPLDTHYLLFDMNNDGIKELFLYYPSNNSSGGTVNVFSYNNGSPKAIARSEIYMAHELYFGYSDHNKLELVELSLASEAGDYCYVKTEYSLVNGSYDLKKECVKISEMYKDKTKCKNDGCATMKNALKVYKAINDDGTPNYSGLV